MISCIIVEDIVMAAESLSVLLEKVAPGEFEIHWVQYAEDAIALIDYLKPDLVFMDIQLGTDDGFSVLEESKGKYGKVIFTTAYSDSAIRAFKYNAIDYLLKPISRQDLSEAIDRYKAQSAPAVYNIGAEQDFLSSLKDMLHEGRYQRSGMLFVSDQGVYKNIDVDNIIYLMAQRSYSNIVCTDTKYISSKNLSYYHNELSAYPHFKKIHKSYVVNCKMIKHIKKGIQSTVELIDGTVLPLSESEKKMLFQYLGL